MSTSRCTPGSLDPALYICRFEYQACFPSIGKDAVDGAGVSAALSTPVDLDFLRSFADDLHFESERPLVWWRQYRRGWRFHSSPGFSAVFKTVVANGFRRADIVTFHLQS